METTEEIVVKFACPIRIQLLLPKDCVLDEEALKERIQKAGPQLFIGLCDACPHYRAQNKD